MTGVDVLLGGDFSMIGQGLLGLMTVRARQAVQERTPDGDDAEMSRGHCLQGKKRSRGAERKKT